MPTRAPSGPLVSQTKGIAITNLVVIIFVVAALFTIALGIYGSLEITHIPYLPIPYTPEDYKVAYEKVEFKSKDGTVLRGWFIPADTASPVTIIVLHGLGSNSGDMLPGSIFLRNGGKWNLFFMDLRGHGISEGSRTSLGPLELEDFEAGLAYLKTSKPEASQRLGMYGHSLGAAVAIVAADTHPELEAIAAESPFYSISNTVRRFSWIYYGIPYFPFIPLALLFTSIRLKRPIGDFAPVKAIGKIAPRPLFMIQAERDLRMPTWEAEVLYKEAKEPKEWWVAPGADHGEPWLLARDEFEKRMLNFFRKVLP